MIESFCRSYTFPSIEYLLETSTALERRVTWQILLSFPSDTFSQYLTLLYRNELRPSARRICSFQSDAFAQPPHSGPLKMFAETFHSVQQTAVSPLHGLNALRNT